MASIPVNFVVIVSFLFFIIYGLGIHNFLTRVEENACQMTYMFEYPQYVELSMPPHIEKKYPRYALYGYSEGSRTEDLRRMRFSGVPVLFIPGNSGSHRQGRSLASIALRRALNSRSPFHFDFFLVDFNEDLSGIYGGVLDDHSQFVRLCISRVLELYRRDVPYFPNSVVLIGHSAGGIVAKSVFIDSSFDPQQVRLIITLASPLQMPAIQTDAFIADFYDRVSKVWNPRTENVSQVTLISMGGGKRDALVRSDLIKDNSSDINVLTSGIPGVYCSTDHLSITWCKQLILTIVRALFDCVDLETKQITKNQVYRGEVFNYHLLKRSAGKKYIPHSARSAFETNGRWIENLLRQFSVVERTAVKKPQFLMLRLIEDIKHEEAFIEAINLNVKDWVYACSADSIQGDMRVCDVGVNLSNLTEIMPSQKLRRKMVQLDMLGLKARGLSHVLVRIAPGQTSVQVNVDIHRRSDRILSHPVPRIMSFTRDVIIDQTADNSVFYSVSLPGFEQVWQAFTVGLETQTCKMDSSHAVVTFSVPWANETSHYYLVDKLDLSETLSLSSPRPPKFNKTAAPLLTFTLDPSCKYRITISPNKLAAAGQFARYYSTLIPAYIIAILLLTLRRQLHCLEERSGIPLFHNALAQAIRNYYIILQATIIGSKIFGVKFFQSFLPSPDSNVLLDLGLDFFVLPIFLFGLATAIVYIAGALIYAAIIISGQAAHKLAFRFLAKTITGFILASEWAMSALHQLPFVAAILIISIGYSTTGGLAMVLSAAFYFLKLCKLYEDYLEDLFKMSLKFVARTFKKVTQRQSPKSEIPATTTEKLEDAKTSHEVDNVTPDESAKSNDVTEKSKDDVEEVEPVMEVVEGGPIVEDLSTLEEIHFHVTLCLLYIMASALTVPSILAWSRSFHQSSRLLLDPAFVQGIIFPAAGCIFWQGGVPRPNRMITRLSSSVLFVLATLSIMFGSISLYRLWYFTTAAIVYLVFHQISSRLL